MKSTVPFTIRNVFQGFAKTEGILSVDGADLKLEFQTTDTMIGLLKSGIWEVRLPLDEVEEIAFRKGLFGSSLVIRVAGMRAASEVPGFKHAEIALSVSKKHSQAAADLVSSIQIAPGGQTRAGASKPSGGQDLE
jgi:hypothetical protein